MVVQYLSAGDLALCYHRLPLSQEFNSSCINLDLAGLDRHEILDLPAKYNVAA